MNRRNFNKCLALSCISYPLNITNKTNKKDWIDIVDKGLDNNLWCFDINFKETHNISSLIYLIKRQALQNYKVELKYFYIGTDICPNINNSILKQVNIFAINDLNRNNYIMDYLNKYPIPSSTSNVIIGLSDPIDKLILNKKINNHRILLGSF